MKVLKSRIATIVFALALAASLQLAFASIAYAEEVGENTPAATNEDATTQGDGLGEQSDDQATGGNADIAGNPDTASGMPTASEDEAAGGNDVPSNDIPSDDSVPRNEGLNDSSASGDLSNSETTENTANDASVGGSETPALSPDAAAPAAEPLTTTTAPVGDSAPAAAIANGAANADASADTKAVVPTLRNGAATRGDSKQAPTEIFLDPSAGKDTNDGSSEAPVKTFDQVLELLKANPSIKTIYISSTLTASGEMSLPEGVVIKRAPGFTGTLIRVSGGTELTLSNITIDGDESQQYTGVMINVANGATLNTNEGTVLQNNNRLASGDGGAVYVAKNATYNMNEGTLISNNSASLGGGVYVRGLLNMYGGTIDSNFAPMQRSGSKWEDGNGGGIHVANGGIANIYDGVVSNNESESYGGGISVGGAREYSDTPKLYMYGGTVIGNKTYWAAGGGIFVQAGTYAYIEAGKILNNIGRLKSGSPEWFVGGGIYVNGGYDIAPYYVKDGRLDLGKVYISDNYSQASGGGIANCPTSTISIYVSNGAAIGKNYIGSITQYDNGVTVKTGTPSDFYITSATVGFNGVTDHAGNPTMYLSSIMLGGAKNNWTYRNGSKESFEILDEYYTMSPNAYLHFVNNISAEDLERAYGKATVFIMGNYARYGKGGGIGSNGIVNIGVEHPEYGALTVGKTVEGDETAKDKEFTFRVTLDYKFTGTYGDMEFVDGVAEFTLKHGESKTATGLIPDIEYTVEELDAEGFESSFTTGATGAIVGKETSVVSALNKQIPEEPEEPSEPEEPETPEETKVEEPERPMSPSEPEPEPEIEPELKPEPAPEKPQPVKAAKKTLPLAPRVVSAIPQTADAFDAPTLAGLFILLLLAGIGAVVARKKTRSL